MYDIFYIGSPSDTSYKTLKQRFPAAKYAVSVVDAKNRSLTKFLWIVYDDVIIQDDFKFDYKVDQWSEKYTHVFLNGEFYDGIALMPKKSHHGPGELQARFYINKKFVDILASVPRSKRYDMVFISYQEPNADENFEKIKQKFSRVQRVHGVKGIHQAHIEAAKLCTTEMFWAIDGDAIIDNDFNFSYIPEHHNKQAVHVWRSLNPINNLIYGYGGVKLLPTAKTLAMDTSKPDMTTSISDKFVAMKQVSNITAFNTGEFETWKSAFRECVKLASKTIDRQKDDETDRRLKIWCTVGRERPFGEFAISGARAGMSYGLANKGDVQALTKINDFDWLKEQFDGNL